MVGVQIAQRLHAVLTLLLSAEIRLPQEPVAVAGITASGTVSYNHVYSQPEIDELVGEYYGLVEQEKLTRMHDLNTLLGVHGTIDRKLLKGHHIILVSDGLKTGFSIDLAVEFLKPIDIESLVMVTPFASIQAVDRMHILADDLYCLSVIEDYISTNHYYDKQDVPDHEIIMKTVKDIVENWQ